MTATMDMSARQPMAAVRPGEVTVDLPEGFDASVYFIGRISTPWATTRECPRRGDMDNGPVCRIEIFEPWAGGLVGLDKRSHVQVLYWMHRARRDLILQSPRHNGLTSGTFSLRSPNRPNPIAASLAALVGVEGRTLLVRGLDCIDGTPLIDVKPEHCPHAPAPDGPA